MLSWIVSNKEWLFQGAGIAMPIALIGWYLSFRDGNKGDQSALKQKPFLYEYEGFYVINWLYPIVAVAILDKPTIWIISILAMLCLSAFTANLIEIKRIAEFMRPESMWLMQGRLDHYLKAEMEYRKELSRWRLRLIGFMLLGVFWASLLFFELHWSFSGTGLAVLIFIVLWSGYFPNWLWRKISSYG